MMHAPDDLPPPPFPPPLRVVAEGVGEKMNIYNLDMSTLANQLIAKAVAIEDVRQLFEVDGRALMYVVGWKSRVVLFWIGGMAIGFLFGDAVDLMHRLILSFSMLIGAFLGVFFTRKLVKNPYLDANYLRLKSKSSITRK